MLSKSGSIFPVQYRLPLHPFKKWVVQLYYNIWAYLELLASTSAISPFWNTQGTCSNLCIGKGQTWITCQSSANDNLSRFSHSEWNSLTIYHLYLHTAFISALKKSLFLIALLKLILWFLYWPCTILFSIPNPHTW